ncbi:carbonic anhydrase 7-like [Centruroides sculpturatus]|uniref:carbonic anhydrase 7-like n=1 Tax=Centruroides sculpturatus TaxID=218467 RepID=UPI000C6DC41B|nr:carbonic anhydrase 7-like [Centruroides sculpturatus]
MAIRSRRLVKDKRKMANVHLNIQNYFKFFIIIFLNNKFNSFCFVLLTAEWSYDGSYGDGPNDWPGLCQSGTEQSPINIDCSYVVVNENLDCFDFSDYNKRLRSVKIENSNGKTIKVTPNDDIKLSGGSLPGTFKLEEFHFHWRAEHSYYGGFNPLELHFVHKNEKYSTLQEALQYRDGVAVIAVFFEVFIYFFYNIECIFETFLVYFRIQ